MLAPHLSPYACLGAHWVQSWPNLSVICEEGGHEGWLDFCHHILESSYRRLRGCSSRLCSASTHWEPSSQHRMLEQVGPQRHARDLGPQFTYTSLHRCPASPVSAGLGWGAGNRASVGQTPSFLLTPLCHQSALLPAGLRQKDQTQKAATGPFDREHLLMYLEKEALEQKDREDFVPFTGEKKGKDHRYHILGQRDSGYLVTGSPARELTWKWEGSPRTGFFIKRIMAGRDMSVYICPIL